MNSKELLTRLRTTIREEVSQAAYIGLTDAAGDFWKESSITCIAEAKPRIEVWHMDDPKNASKKVSLASLLERSLELSDCPERELAMSKFLARWAEKFRKKAENFK